MARIVYIQYTNPAGYPPLEHSSRLLLERGWEVLFLGTGAKGANSLRFAPLDRLTVRLLPFCDGGWGQKLHYVRFTLWAVAQTIRFRPAWIYASDPFSCPVAWLLSWLPGWRVIYHEHDSPNAARSKFMKWVLWTRRRLARRAAVCILPNAARVARFVGETSPATTPVCVWNCPRRAEASAARGVRDKDSLWVLYHGSIVPARLPVTVLTALTQLPDGVRLRVVGYETVGHPGYVRQLKEAARRLGIGDRVEFLGALPTRVELLEQARRSDVGLAFMPATSQDVNEQAMAGASNKPFDYLACGLALLVSDLPEWRALYVEPGFARVVNQNDPASLAAVLRWLWDHPAEMRTMGEGGRQRILTDWNYEQQFAPVGAIMEVG